jgi:hypothetical protein
MIGLTDAGRALVAAFNRRWVYARCLRCGVFAAPPRDGYRYRCARVECGDALVELDPETLRGGAQSASE